MDPSNLDHHDYLRALANFGPTPHFQDSDLTPWHAGDPIANTPVNEINQLRQENVELCAAVAFIMFQGGHLPLEPRHTRRPGRLSTLPADIVRLIFKETIPASYEYKSSLPNSPSNPWLQVQATKAALPRICRALYWEGMSVLYNDIVLRRMSQIFMLARTLRSPRGPDLCFFIKTIRMDSCPVGGNAASTAKEELRSILQQCHALRSLSYHPHPNFPFLSDESKSSSGDSYFNPTWFFHVSTFHNQPSFLDGPLASRLNRLDLQFILTRSLLRNLHDLLLATVSLQSLTLDYSVQDPLSEALEGFSVVQLPCLVEVYMPFDQDATFDEYICTRWDVPKLTRLTLMSFQWWPERPLERFGQRLVYLHVFAKYFRDPFFCDADPCPRLASLCPILEHLIIPNPHNCIRLFPETTVNSPTLKHLDFWDFSTHECLTSRARYYPWMESSPPSSGRLVDKIRSYNSVQSLRTVRFLFTEYGQYRGVDWPSICHPDLLLDRPDDEIWHFFPEAYVAQTVTRLTPHSPHPLSDYDYESTSGSNSDDDWTPGSSPVKTDTGSEASHWTDEEVVGDTVEDAVEVDYL